MVPINKSLKCQLITRILKSVCKSLHDISKTKKKFVFVLFCAPSLKQLQLSKTIQRYTQRLWTKTTKLSSWIKLKILVNYYRIPLPEDLTLLHILSTNNQETHFHQSQI